MWHDSTMCSSFDWVLYHITIDSSYIGQTVHVVDTFSGTLTGTFVNTLGTSPWSFLTGSVGYAAGAAYYGGRKDLYIVSGYAHFDIPPVKITADADTVFDPLHTDSIYVSNPCSYGTVSGRIYADNNGNCAFDSGESGINPFLSGEELKLHEVLSSPATPEGEWHISSFSTSGAYSIDAQESWMTNYTVSLPSSLFFIFPASSCFAGPYAFTSFPQTGVDFPLLCSSNVDVACNVLTPAAVRLHKPFSVQPYVNNTGCDLASGQLTLVKDSHVIYDASLSSVPADIVSGDTLKWNYSGLTSLSSGGYWNSFLSNIHLETDATVALGDTLCFRVYTNIPAADVNTTNNDYTICVPVVYSYDPNLKEVSPKGTGPQGFIPGTTDTLTYTLHFQNTGNTEAENIKVIDTLDSHINAASLRILGTSHKMTPKWLTTNVVQFSFDNINLPDSGTNFAASQGAVQFKVAVNAGLAYGTQIRNKGYIYFDLNPPVITNGTLNTISWPESIAETPANTGVRVYPNPATDIITVEGSDAGEISVMNFAGTTVMSQAASGNKTLINIVSLPGGVYMIKTLSTTKTTITKFTKY